MPSHDNHPIPWNDLLQRCAAVDATDLHVQPGAAPRLRCGGRLEPMPGVPVTSPEATEALVRELLDESQWQEFERHTHFDFAVTDSTGNRYRANAYRHERGVALAVRRLQDSLREPEAWNLPASLRELTTVRDGLVVVTGPTGSGKTTTLASLIHVINAERPCHILTIEDPVEYVHRSDRALVSQREVRSTVPDFASAVRAALREDPDVILVGEMRDLETMRATLTAAETGHLVFSTMHTGTAVGAVERFVGLFPAEEQDSIRQQLSLVLRAVVAQRLVPAARDEGLVPAVELLLGSTAVANLIRTGRTEQIRSVMEGATAEGMSTLEQHLAALVRGGRITREEAFRHARQPGQLRLWLDRERAGARR